MREFSVVAVVALLGLVIAGAVILAPWHPAHASEIVEFISPR